MIAPRPDLRDYAESDARRLGDLLPERRVDGPHPLREPETVLGAGRGVDPIEALARYVERGRVRAPALGRGGPFWPRAVPLLYRPLAGSAKTGSPSRSRIRRNAGTTAGSNCVPAPSRRCSLTLSAGQPAR